MAPNNPKTEIADRVSVKQFASAENKTGKEQPYALLTFNGTHSEESISVSAVKLLCRDLNELLKPLESPGIYPGAMFSGKNHAANHQAPEDWVAVDLHVEGATAQGLVTEANLNFEFRYTETVEAVSLPAARQLQADLNALVAKIAKEAQLGQEPAERT